MSFLRSAIFSQRETTLLFGGRLETGKAKFFYFMVKGAQPYPEGMGSLFFRGKILQVATNDFLFSLLHGYANRKFDLFGVHAGTNVLRKIINIHGVPFRHQHHALHNIFELSDVARPGIAL